MMIDVENATDVEFDGWVKRHQIPVDDDKFGDVWEFEDRCGVINYALQIGIKLEFLEGKQFKNNSVVPN